MTRNLMSCVRSTSSNSATFPALNKPIALALLAAGRSRHGEILHAAAPLTGTCVKVQITSPVFYDPDGARLRG